MQTASTGQNPTGGHTETVLETGYRMKRFYVVKKRRKSVIKETESVYPKTMDFN